MWVMIVIMMAGLGLTLFQALPVIILGIAAVTFGFFGAHSIASSWVGRRARNEGEASALYLFCYYFGSSAIGTLGGVFWSNWGWIGVCVLVTTLLLIALALAFYLASLPPLTDQSQPSRIDEAIVDGLSQIVIIYVQPIYSHSSHSID